MRGRGSSHRPVANPPEWTLSDAQSIQTTARRRAGAGPVPDGKDGALAGQPGADRCVTCGRSAEDAHLEQEARADRLETVGRLASGVAHELNNILGPVVVYPELIIDELTSRFGITADDPICEELQLIENAALQAAAVIQDLLALTRQGSRPQQRLDPAHALQAFLQGDAYQALTQSHAGVQVHCAAAATLPPICFQQGRFPRLLENLLGFAMGSAAPTGHVSIHLGRQVLDSALVAYTPIPAGDYLVVSVEDDGPPLSDGDLCHLFEPFYARRRMGRAVSGLALAVAYALVQESSGGMSVGSNESGAGTVIRAYLPVVTGTAERPRQPDTRGGQEHVLLVDDEAGQRLLGRRLLEGMGCQVDTVASGAEALAWLRSKHADVLVLDMVLEDGFDGLDTWREVIQLRPDQKALIASGYSQSERVEEALALGVAAFVEKPYTRDRLANVLRRVLGESADA